jgi:hypothetical protein
MHSFARTAVAVSLAVAGLQATAEAQARPKADRNRLTSEEIRARPVTTVHELIRSRRPSWLSVRGSATFETRTVQDPYSATRKPMTVGVEPSIIVYVDAVRHGSHEVLRSMSTEDVESIERLDAASATQRFGTGHEHGAIVIRRRTR